MGKILKKLALLFVPVALYFAFFLYFEPNNYFGLKESAAGTAPICRVKAFAQDPHTRQILGDSRLAHIDMDEVEEWGGEGWQDLAFGGASLRETLDLLEYCLETQPDTSQILLEVSFYTLNAKYDTDRMSALQDTLDNPLAYLFNLEYNVIAFTSFRNWLIWQGQVRRGEMTSMRSARPPTPGPRPSRRPRPPTGRKRTIFWRTAPAAPCTKSCGIMWKSSTRSSPAGR